jgi:hypothetical protein
MKITGQQLIDAVARRLNEEDVRCYGSAISAKIGLLTAQELAQLTDFGDVSAWHNDRIEKALIEKLRAEDTI